MKIRDLVYGQMAGERPRRRKGIIDFGLWPDTDVETWNGETAPDPTGVRFPSGQVLGGRCAR